MEYKVCSKCFGEKLVSEFWSHKRTSDGLQAWCKSCKREHSQLPENKAALAAYCAVPARKEAKAAYNATAQAKAARAENNRAPEARERVSKWRRSPTGLASNRQSNRSRRALNSNAEGSHTALDISNLYALQSGKCACCGAGLGDVYHVDHVHPLSKGGSNWPSNLQLLCKPCNLQKAAKHPIDFMQQKGFLL